MSEYRGEKEQMKWRKHRKLSGIGIAVSVVVLLLLGGIFALIFRFFHQGRLTDLGDKAEEFVSDLIIGTEGKVTTITETALREVLEVSELSTADYDYNAIARVYDFDARELKYYVAYEGTVKAGIDFDKIIIEKDDEEKIIYLKIPNCEIQDTIVDFGSMEYIFADPKANTENVSQAAYKACEEDLKKRVAADRKLLAMAKENAVDAVEALVVPWVAQVDSEYTVKIQ